jgi:nuclear transport factor 2 (NTF2) superfamily protein
LSDTSPVPCSTQTLNGRAFISEHWDREVWYEWAAMLLAMQWDGVGRPMPPEWYEWADFSAEWFRALFDCGKECGFVVYDKR